MLSSTMQVEIEEQLDSLSMEELSILNFRMEWKDRARLKQLAPEGEWLTWGVMSGRGFGKTLCGAHWLLDGAFADAGSFNGVIAPTRDDVRYVCFEGETGIISMLPDCLILDYNKSDLIIYLWGGSIIRGFGSERPERLRGPQHHRVWCDELAAWTNAKECWSMMQFGLRLGKKTQCVWTTTPKPVPIIKERVMEESPKHLITRGTTYENRDNLAPSFYEEVAKYEGTRLGRQELEGELIDPEESGIVKRSDWQLWPYDKPLPRFIHIVYSLDTAFTEKTYDEKHQENDPSACAVWGLFQLGKLLQVMLLDCWGDYLGLPQLVKKVRDDQRVTYGQADAPLINPVMIPSPYQMQEHSVLVGRGVDLILIEDKGSGISLRQTLAMENLLMEKYNPGRADKLARLHSITPMFAHKRVWAVESALAPETPRSWADPLISQVCSYSGPGTTEHDDFVDATTQALNYFMRKFIRTFVPLSEEERMRREEQELLVERRAHNNPYDA